MRIPHHLVRSPSGIYHFRLKVPKPLQEAWGLKVIKQSLRTTSLPHARGRAMALALHYAHAFHGAGNPGMSKPPALDDIISGFHQHGRKFEADLDPHTGRPIRVRTDGTAADAKAAEEFVHSFATPRVVMPPGLPQISLAPAQERRPAASGMTLAEAVRSFCITTKEAVAPDTFDARIRALHSFMAFIKPDTLVTSITRKMVYAWGMHIFTEQNIIGSTVGGYVTHVSQLFEMLKDSGEVEGDNPATGAWKNRDGSKKQRVKKGFGWEAFEERDLKTIFGPTNFRRLGMAHSRWAPLIGLFTGARVGEIAQLYLRDFEMVEGHPCIRITEESDEQALKSEPSKRLVPLHPVLIDLGLWTFVQQLRARKEVRLFPGIRLDGKAGRGSAISKTFTTHLEGLNIKARRENGTLGFHSLRKTVIQALQGSALTPERRRSLVGHEPGDDVHTIHYMRPWTPAELSGFREGLPWGEWLDVPALRAHLNAPERGEKARAKEAEATARKRAAKR